MGLFDSIADGFRNLTGGVDQQLLATGILARGEILALTPSGTTLTVGNGIPERNCAFTLRVMMDGEQPFDATVSQRVQELWIPQLQQSAVVAVRVDPNDHSKVAIDFSTQPPEVNLPESKGENSGAWILEHGKPVTVVLVANQPIGVNNHKGDPVHALTLTLATGVETPYQVQVGNAVPATALPLLFPGSKLHAKLGQGPNDVVVDWAAGAAS
jgi:hypothetical protein